MCESTRMAASLNELLEFTDALAVDIPELRTGDAVLDELEKEAPIVELRPSPDPSRRSNEGDRVDDVAVKGSRSTALTAGEKQQRVRDRERAKYRRKKEKVAGLKEQVAALEKQLKVMADPTMAPTAAFHDGALVVEDTRTDGHESRRDQLQALYLKAMQAKALLRSENTQLRKQFREASQCTVLLSDLLKTEHKLYIAHASYFRLLKPLSRQTCLELNTNALMMMPAFEAELSRVSAVSSLAGWRGKRFVDGNLFKFALDKTYRWFNAQKLLSMSWSNIVDPGKLEKMYSPDMNMRARLVQKIDDDNYVFLEEMRSTNPGDNGALVKTAVLFSKIKTERGYRMYFLNLDRRQIELEERATGESVKLEDEMWISKEQLAWVDIEVIDGETVRQSFRGMIPIIGANAYFWMSEIVMVCLRCELFTLGPCFRVASS